MTASAPDSFDSPDGRTYSGPVTAGAPGQPDRETLIAAAAEIHDGRCGKCDRKYRMSCPDMANAILEAGKRLREASGTPGQAARFRLRPITVEAIQWAGDNLDKVYLLTGCENFDVLSEQDRANCDDPEATATVFARLHNSTWKLVYTGQWIVKGAKGEFFPLPDKLFREAYDPADSDAPAPDQAAYLAWHRSRYPGQPSEVGADRWASYGNRAKSCWEAAAQAAVDAFLAGDSVSAGSIREALAAQGARPAPEPREVEEIVRTAVQSFRGCRSSGPVTDCPGCEKHVQAILSAVSAHLTAPREPKPAPGLEAAYLYHWRFDRGEEFGLYWHRADADAAAAARAAEYPGEGLFGVLGMAILGDRPEPQPAPGGPLRSDAETAAMLRADLEDAEAQLAKWPRCPSGCSCRFGFEGDADRNECGCDGPCNGGEQPAPGDVVAKLRADLLEEIAYHGELANDILLNAPENFDGDEAADSIAVRYVRWLETERAQLTGGTVTIDGQTFPQPTPPVEPMPAPDSRRLILGPCPSHEGQVHAQILDEPFDGTEVWACLRALADIAEGKSAGITVQPATEQAAPELAAALAEPRKLRDLIRELIGMAVSGTMTRRGADRRLKRIAEEAGIEPPAVLAERFQAPGEAAEAQRLRELLDEVGVMAANAPEDGDSFAVCEEIAMRVAAIGPPS